MVGGVGGAIFSGSRPSITVEPLVIWSQHLALPPSSEFVGDEDELVTVLHELSDLNFVAMFVHLEVCLVWSGKKTLMKVLTDSICFRNVDFKTKLVL